MISFLRWLESMLRLDFIHIHFCLSVKCLPNSISKKITQFNGEADLPVGERCERGWAEVCVCVCVCVCACVWGGAYDSVKCRAEVGFWHCLLDGLHNV